MEGPNSTISMKPKFSVCMPVQASEEKVLNEVRVEDLQNMALHTMSH